MENAAVWSKRVISIGFGLLFILVPLILTPWNYELFEYNKMMVTYGLTTLIVGAWIINMVATGTIRIKRTPLDIPIILFVLSQFVSAIFSMDPHVSWFGYYSRFNGGMFSVISYVLLYYAFVSNVDTIKNQISEIKIKDQQNTLGNPSKGIIRLMQAILITGLIVSIYGIAEHFGIDKNLWVQDVQNRVFSTLGQPNWLAAYLIALVPLAFAMGLMQLSTLLSLLYLLISIIFFITILWTRSRSGFVALAVADVVFWGMIIAKHYVILPIHKLTDIRQRIKKALQTDKLVQSFLFIHGAFFLIIVVNGTYIKQIDDWVTAKAWQNRFYQIVYHPSPIQQNVATASGESESQAGQSNASVQPSSSLIESGVTDSGDIRKYVWQGAVNAWKSSPKALSIGTGTETFAFAFYLYKPIGHNLTSEWDFLYNKAHNEYLNFLATTGLFGLGTYLLIIMGFAFWFIKSQIKNHNPPSASWRSGQTKSYLSNSKPYPGEVGIDIEYLQIGLFAGWLSVLITNFFGFSVVITQLFLYLFPAFLFVCQSKSTNKEFVIPLQWTKTMKKIVSWAAGIVAGLLFVSVCIMWYADKQFAQGYHLSRAGYLPQAYQSLASAITLNPAEPMYHDEQGNVLATLALSAWKENQATMSQELTNMSIKENDVSLAISPNNVNFWKTRTKIFYTLTGIDPTFLKEAIRAIEKGIKLSPFDPKMYYNLAILYGQDGAGDKSLEAMKKSIALKPNYREGYYGLYLLYKESGRFDEATQTIKDYLAKVDPTDTEFKSFIQ